MAHSLAAGSTKTPSQLLTSGGQLAWEGLVAVTEGETASLSHGSATGPAASDG